jgi:uncharacterized protein (TIGR02757 family)
MNLNRQCSEIDRISRLKAVLERLYRKYNHKELIKPDPLQFMSRYSDRTDMEIAGFLAAALAYGRIRQIENSVNELLDRMGDSPAGFVRGFDKSKREKLHSFKHRFTSGNDFSDLLELLREVIERFGSMENFFVTGYNASDRNIIPALSNFCDSLLDMYHQRHNRDAPKGLAYLLCRPQQGSACKRLNLFLRWMVRDDDVDSGLWQSIDKAKLIVPVDVHMARLCRILGLYKRKTVTLQTAVEITESFAQIEPADPVKYDFALSRIGIVDNCTGRCRSGCEFCELFSFCSDK